VCIILSFEKERIMLSFAALTSLLLQLPVLIHVSRADITFAVDNVTEFSPQFLVGTIEDVVNYCSKYEVVHSDVDLPEQCLFVKEYEDPFHSLLAAVQKAYADHRPLVLTPDHVWVTVLQGLALHNSQPGVQSCYKVSELSDAGTVKCNTWDDIYNAVSSHLVDSSPFPSTFQSFTTTDTKAEKMAGMGAVAEPHEDNTCYNRQMQCGIPRITLQGSPADWDALLSKVENLLDRCDLQWWLCALKPVLTEFTKAARGQVRTEFWRNIYRFRPDEVLATGCWFVSGWFMTLYPYITDGSKTKYTRNPQLRFLCQHNASFDWSTKPSSSSVCPMIDTFPILQTQNFPSGLSEIQFTCSKSGDRMSVVSGFVGYCVGNLSNSVHPVLGWLVTNKSELCHLSGDNCLDDCACGGHGKCEKADEVIGAGDLFGGGIIGGIGGLGGGAIGEEDNEEKKSCKCFPGWRGVDCSQKCPPPSCGEFCGQFCEEDQVCDYEIGYCVPVQLTNITGFTVTPTSTMQESSSSTTRKSSTLANHISFSATTKEASSSTIQESSSSVALITTSSSMSPQSPSPPLHMTKSSKDTISTTVNCPVYGGVLILEVVHMLM
jgi:hypothetical protein